MSNSDAASATRLRIKVDLYCSERDQHRSCRTGDINLEGLFIVGIPCLRMGSEVVVTFGEPGPGALRLPCVVDMVTLDGAHLAYHNPSSAAIEELREILWPKWNRDDLLQGVLILSQWHRASSLSEWMRLTSIASDYHHCLSRMRADIRRNALDKGAIPNPDEKPAVGPLSPASNWPHSNGVAA